MEFDTVEQLAIVSNLLLGIQNLLEKSDAKMGVKKFALIVVQENIESYFAALVAGITNLTEPGIENNVATSQLYISMTSLTNIIKAIYFTFNSKSQHQDDRLDELQEFILCRQNDLKLLQEREFLEEDFAELELYKESLAALDHVLKTQKTTKSARRVTVSREPSLYKKVSADFGNSPSKILRKTRKSFYRSNSTHNEEKEVFMQFKWDLMHSDFVKDALKEEIGELAKLSQKRLLDSDPCGTIEQQVNFQFFCKAIAYQQETLSMESVDETKFLVELLSTILDVTDSESNYKGDSSTDKVNVQNKLHQIGAVKIALELMCAESSEVVEELFPTMIHFANRILDGAANEI